MRPSQRRTFRRAFASPSFVAGSVMLTVIVLAAVFAPVLAPFSPTEQDLSAGLLPPSAQHLFGTDQLGRDVFSRVLFAARTDLGIAFAAALSPFVVGIALGLISGYFGRSTDWLISRVTDTVIAFPFYVLIIAIVFAIGAGAKGIIITFALVGWVGYARVIRALTASMREQGWVRAARGGGLSHARILVRHILPNVMPQAVVLLATEIVLIMIAIVTLGYLGLGVRPPTPDWGTMIADGQAFVTSHWWLSALPGLAVVVVGVALSMLGDGVGDALRVVSGGSRLRPRLGRRSGPVLRPRVRSTPLTSQLPTGSLRVHALFVDPAQMVASGRAKRQDAPDGPRGGLVGGAHGLDLEVQAGEALGIVGESGSGKSLTLRAIAGLLPPGVQQTGGEIHVGGSLGMVFQDPLTALDPLTRVGTQLREACKAAGALDPAARVLELLADVRLPDAARIARSYPHELSGGQRQRLVIAMALAGDPAVLLADEPTTALDVTVQRDVLELLETLRRERGLTLVFVSHDLAVVSSVCERIVVMRHGQIVERGATARVLAQPEHPYTRELIAAVPELPELRTPSTLTSPGPAPTPSTSHDPNSSRSVAPEESFQAPESRFWGHAEQEGGGPEAEAGAGPEAGPEAGPGPEARPGAVLGVRGVAIHYGRREAVTDISFDVHGSLGIVGESGSGKTTIARAIAGELPISAGEIEFAGEPLPSARRSRKLRTAIQLIPQDPTSSLNPRLTAGQMLSEVLRVHRAVPRRDERERVAELLTQVGLERTHADAYPHELSGGQRQRVAIARALAVSPRLLIADEATSALDVSVQADIIALLQRLRDELGLALIVISHDLAVVHALCDEIVVMRAGRVVEQGENVLVDPQQPYTRTLLEAVPRLA